MHAHPGRDVEGDEEGRGVVEAAAGSRSTSGRSRRRARPRPTRWPDRAAATRRGGARRAPPVGRHPTRARGPGRAAHRRRARPGRASPPTGSPARPGPRSWSWPAAARRTRRSSTSTGTSQANGSSRMPCRSVPTSLHPARMRAAGSWCRCPPASRTSSPTPRSTVACAVCSGPCTGRRCRSKTTVRHRHGDERARPRKRSGVGWSTQPVQHRPGRPVHGVSGESERTGGRPRPAAPPCGILAARAPGSVKLRAGGDSPRPDRSQRPVDQVQLLDRR